MSGARFVIDLKSYSASSLKSGRCNTVYRVDDFGEPSHSIVLKIPKFGEGSESTRAARVMNTIQERANAEPISLQIKDSSELTEAWITDYISDSEPASEAEYLYGMIELYQKTGYVMMDPYSPGNFRVRGKGDSREIIPVDVDWVMRSDSPTFKAEVDKRAPSWAKIEPEMVYSALRFLHTPERLKASDMWTMISILQCFAWNALAIKAGDIPVLEKSTSEVWLLREILKIALLSGCHHKRDYSLLSIEDLSLFKRLIPDEECLNLVDEAVEILFNRPCSSTKKWTMLFRLSLGLKQLISSELLIKFKLLLPKTSDPLKDLEKVLIEYLEYSGSLPPIKLIEHLFNMLPGYRALIDLQVWLNDAFPGVKGEGLFSTARLMSPELKSESTLEASVE